MSLLDFMHIRSQNESLTNDFVKLTVLWTTAPGLFTFQVRALQKNHEDAKSVNKEIASTLESVMSSHSQLQSVVEGLQIELGKKDSQISRLKNEK